METIPLSDSPLTCQRCHEPKLPPFYQSKSYSPHLICEVITTIFIFIQTEVTHEVTLFVGGT